MELLLALAAAWPQYLCIPYLQTGARYQNLVNGAEEVESCLGACFAEHLNAEIVLQTVRTVDQAFEWLRTTFLYIRVNNIMNGIFVQACVNMCELAIRT